MFKPNPKAQVKLKFDELFGKGHKVEVLGTRVNPEDCRRRGLKCTSKDGIFHAELFVDGQLLAQASRSDWRDAYKALKVEVEKLYVNNFRICINRRYSV